MNNQHIYLLYRIYPKAMKVEEGLLIFTIMLHSPLTLYYFFGQSTTNYCRTHRKLSWGWL